jgi:hypothetical protein
MSISLLQTGQDGERMEQSKNLPALPRTAEVQFMRNRRSVLEEPVAAVQVRLSENRGRIRGPDQIRVKWREGSYRIGEYCREY